MAQNERFQYGVRETQEWCAVVYGNPHAMNQQLATILSNPQKGEQILQDLLENPEGPGKLAGQKLLGVKSPARKEAEDGFAHLCSALERHVQTAQKLHTNLTREQERGREHEGRAEGQERGHHHHHHHRSHERGEDSPEQTRGRHGPAKGKGGMAFAM